MESKIARSDALSTIIVVHVAQARHDSWPGWERGAESQELRAEGKERGVRIPSRERQRPDGYVRAAKQNALLLVPMRSMGTRCRPCHSERSEESS